jgi:hypothetical protein
MADLVDETVRGIRAPLMELTPVVAGYERLQAAYASLDGPRSHSNGRTAARGSAQSKQRSGASRDRPSSGPRPSARRAKRG